MFWGLAVDGEAGLEAVLEMLRDELDATMGMTGCADIDSINSAMIDTVSPLLASFPSTADFR